MPRPNIGDFNLTISTLDGVRSLINTASNAS